MRDLRDLMTILADMPQFPCEAREGHQLNLVKAADIMRHELFAPHGISVPSVPVRNMHPIAAALMGADGR